MYLHLYMYISTCAGHVPPFSWCFLAALLARFATHAPSEWVRCCGFIQGHLHLGVHGLHLGNTKLTGAPVLLGHVSLLSGTSVGRPSLSPFLIPPASDCTVCLLLHLQSLRTDACASLRSACLCHTNILPLRFVQLFHQLLDIDKPLALPVL
jgi:hypothetical protein